jgi:FtsP/CotA-like multicopper oxidase with cupredoxin domain
MKQFAFVCLALGYAVALQAQTTVNYNVILRSNATTVTMWDGNVLTAFGMAPSISTMATVPAFTIHCNEGDTVVLNARNVSQGEHHTVHPHGLDVDTRNDGDPATSFWLEHMQDTTYTFIAKHAGTYLYHCHVGDVLHVQMGMYGLVIVHAAGGAVTAWTGGPAFNREYAWLCSEMDEYWHDSIPEHDPLTDTLHIPPYEPDYFLINGKSETQLASDTRRPAVAGAAQYGHGGCVTWRTLRRDVNAGGRGCFVGGRAVCGYEYRPGFERSADPGHHTRISQ